MYLPIIGFSNNDLCMCLLIVGFLVSIVYLSMYLLIVVDFLISSLVVLKQFFFVLDSIVAICNTQSIWKGFHLLIYLPIYLGIHVFQLDVFYAIQMIMK
jgi:hypothetical protein